MCVVVRVWTAWQIQDIEMMLRLSREFDFNVSAFHHALETYMIPDIILESGATIATFSDLWGYKMEAYDASVRSPSVLTDAGVSVALKSDHPVLFSKDLMYEAAKAHYYGLNKCVCLGFVSCGTFTLTSLFLPSHFFFPQMEGDCCCDQCTRRCHGNGHGCWADLPWL